MTLVGVWMSRPHVWWAVSVLLLPFVLLDVLSFTRMVQFWWRRGRGRSGFPFIGLGFYMLVLVPLQMLARLAHEYALAAEGALVLRWLVSFCVVLHVVGLALIWFVPSPFQEGQRTGEADGDVR